MLLSNARLFPLLLMLSLALLTFWLERTVRGVEEVHPSLRRHDPDYIVDKLRIVSHDSGGRPTTTLSAQKMTHFPDDDSTELAAPRVLKTKAGEAPLELTADRGALSQDGEDTFLHDNVLLVRQATPLQPEMRLTTSFLHLVQSRSLVLTDREVEIREPGRFLTGRGMEYDNGLGLLHLRARVHGRFEQRKTQ